MITAETEALVITMQADMPPALAAMADLRRWPVLLRPSASQVLHEVRRHRPRVIVVDVTASPLLSDLLGLVSLLRDRHPSTPKVAIAAREDHELELAMRNAGANSYLGIENLHRQLEVVFRALCPDTFPHFARQES